jgi:hypothetical protein
MMSSVYRTLWTMAFRSMHAASSDQVSKCRDGDGSNGSVDPKCRRPPLLYGAVDLGLQPWVGCASRSWHGYGGSKPLPFSENLSFEIQIFVLLSLQVGCLTPNYYPEPPCEQTPIYGWQQHQCRDYTEHAWTGTGIRHSNFTDRSSVD